MSGAWLAVPLAEELLSELAQYTLEVRHSEICIFCLIFFSSLLNESLLMQKWFKHAGSGNFLGKPFSGPLEA